MRIKEIILNFDNHASMSIKNKDIKKIYLDKIYDSIEKNKNGDFIVKKYIETALIEIDKSADDEYYEFEIQKDEFKTTKFKRLSLNDIRSIHFVTDNDGEEHDYYITWTSFIDLDKNINQKTYIDKNKTIYIIIDKNTNIFDYYDSTYIEKMKISEM